MLVNMQKKKMNLNKCAINKEMSEWVEQDIIVPDTKPDAVKIVNVTVTPYVSDTEIMEGRIKVVGKINYFIIYKVDDERFNTRGLFVTYPYTEVLELEGIRPGMHLTLEPRCKNVIYSLPNERKIAIKSEILFQTRVKEMVEVSVIKGFDSETPIECKMCNQSFCNVLDHKSSIIASKEDVMLPKEAEDFFELLNMDAKIMNTEFKESYNKIMVKGDIEVKIIYLSESQSESVKRMNITVPFSAMVELEGINDRSKFEIKYIMQDFNLKMNPDITSTKTMTAEYRIDVDVNMYEEEDLEFVEDFYSEAKDLDFENEVVEAVSKDIVFTKSIDIKENITNILPPNTTILDYTLDTSYITPKITNATVELEGNAKISMLLQDLETFELDHKIIDVLINQKYEIDNMNPKNKSNVKIMGQNLVVTQNGMDIEVRLELDITTNIEDITKLNIIDKLEDLDLDTSNLDSINVYIVKPGDTLWNIAKRYKTTVGKIVKINDIPNPDSIDVGQKILIIR